MNGLVFSLFSIIWILTLAALILFRNNVIVFEWDKDLKVYLEKIDYEGVTDEEREKTNETAKRILK